MFIPLWNVGKDSFDFAVRYVRSLHTYLFVPRYHYVPLRDTFVPFYVDYMCHLPQLPFYAVTVTCVLFPDLLFILLLLILITFEFVTFLLPVPATDLPLPPPTTCLPVCLITVYFTVILLPNYHSSVTGATFWRRGNFVRLLPAVT